jgi:polygalacturonase
MKKLFTKINWKIFILVLIIVFNGPSIYFKITHPSFYLDQLSFSLPDNSSSTSPTGVCNIKDFGAIADSPEKAPANQQAIQKAIDSCVDKQHALFIPAGRWFSGGLYFHNNNSWVFLDKEATLSFVYNPKLYLPLRPSRFEGYELINFSAPLYFDNLTNGGIIGGGKITLQEPEKWHKWDKVEKPAKKLLFKYSKKNTPLKERVFGKESDGLRPPFLQLYNSNNFVLSDIIIDHSTMWTIHSLYSNNLLFQDLTVLTNGPNTDGLVIDSSTGVIIKDNIFSTGDDAIVLKSGSDHDGRRIDKPTEKVSVRNISVHDAHGAVVIGSEMSGGISDVDIKNINISKADIGLRIKTRPGRGGYVQNINLDGLKAEKLTDELIKINNHYKEAIGKTNPSPELYPKIENISLQNAETKSSNRAIFIDGLKELPIKNLTLRNIKAGQEQRSKIVNVLNPRLENINIFFTEKSPFKNSSTVWTKSTTPLLN